ncbi:hypothetical protein [Labrenzia sp. THAF35]|uniref:hypothetical protein n=1 Tax=Labrenzia sp. THAF35 TaxID=2587854 RepID=UPI00126913A3|nr:hypothetical protein [Labrenzia sp. THAF35]
MIDDAKTIWSTIVKYSTIANATALTLSLAAINKLPNGQFLSTAGKLPIWLFFVGLFSGGLHLIFSFYYQIGNIHLEARKNLLEIIERHENKANISQDSTEIIRTSKEIIQEIDETLGVIENNSKYPAEKIMPVLRNIQELLLWVSYICFFVGVFIIVWSI